MKNKVVGHVLGIALILSIFVGGAYYSNRSTVVVVPDNEVQVDPTPEPTPPPPQPAPKPAGTVEILAPDKIKPGELVILSVDGEATSFSWQVIPETDNFLAIDGGRRAVFCNGVPGEFIFVLAFARGGVVEVKMHTITVVGSAPSPKPLPIDAFQTKVASWCEGVESPTKRDDAMKLSQSFISVSATISSGVVKEPKDILEITRTSNQSALGEDGIKRWEPFLEALRSELNAMSSGGKLGDANAHAQMWRAIGEALRAYAETL